MPYFYSHLRDGLAIGKKKILEVPWLTLTFPGALVYQTLPVFVSGRVIFYASMSNNPTLTLSSVNILLHVSLIRYTEPYINDILPIYALL